MQRRLDAHVAAFGEQNRDRIVAVPSSTGQGVHLYFDPERSLSPNPEQVANRNSTDSTEGALVADDPDSGDSSSDLGSDLETVAGPDTPPPRGQVRPSSSHLYAPKAPRHLEREKSPGRSVYDSSSSVHDSLMLIAERKKAMKTHLDGDVEGHLFLELDHEKMLDREKMLDQAENEEGRIAILRRDYEDRLERFRQENADIFGIPAEGVSEHSNPLSPEPFEGEDLPREIPHYTLSRNGPPSRFVPGAQEDHRQHQQHTPLRRQNAHPFTVSQSDEDETSVGADGQFVVVARRVQKLGPCGTVVIDHETGDEKLVTKRYRVREEELFSIDSDGDSVMGSDD